MDEARRALLEVAIRSTPDGIGVAITTWIDTAFNGYLVFSKSLIAELGLNQEAATDAVLADGSIVTLESYICYVEWCGKIVPAQVIANAGKLPLLGTELLAGCVLAIDYGTRDISISTSAGAV